MKTPRWLPLVTTTLLAGAALGCGGTTAPPGYLAQVHSGGQLSMVAFIQLTVSGAHLSGTWSATLLPPGGTETYASQLSLTGTLSGQSVTMTLHGTVSDPEGSTVGTGTISGTLVGTTLTLAVPQVDGGLTSVVFTGSDTAAYDRAVNTLEAMAGTASASAQAAAQASASAAQQAALDAQVTAAAKQVITDIDGLQGLTISTQALAQDLLAQQKDLATMRSDEAATVADSPLEQCGDADTVQGDADTVQGDADTVQGDVETVNAAVGGPEAAISSLQSDFAKLQAIEPTDPEFSGGAYLGVDVAEVSASAPVTAGAQITSVVADSPAAGAGLAAGDVITSLDGVGIGSTDDLSAAMAQVPGGETVDLSWVDASGLHHSGTITLGTLSLPTQAQVNAAAAGAQAVISQATGTASQDLSQAQAVASAAATEAANFVAEYCG